MSTLLSYKRSKVQLPFHLLFLHFNEGLSFEGFEVLITRIVQDSTPLGLKGSWKEHGGCSGHGVFGKAAQYSS
ncbi:hypothetical protein QYF36_004351 [Acer negundo]|nr:hypothetical protein QYF36_004351 [Acer negundo]